MKRSFAAFSLVALTWFAPLLCSADQRDSMDTFYNDASRLSQRFVTDNISGSVTYRASYEALSTQPLFVDLQFHDAAMIKCMNSADFRFDLRENGSARRILNSKQTYLYGGRPLEAVAITRSGCPYRLPTREGVFPFKLDELYPNLAPGHYVLQLTFAPRDGSFPVTSLTPVEFSIAAGEKK